jgi:predicted nucleic-acid-binding protein
MRAAADTNVLVRLFVDDDPAQTDAAMQALMSAEIIAISLQALCELTWVLGSRYQTSRRDIAESIRQLLETANVVVDRPAVMAGLAVLDAGGDFADGIIAFEGRWLGGETFVTFDKQASKILAGQGQATKLLTA